MDVPYRQIRSQSNGRICLSSNRGILPGVVSPSEAKESPAEVVIPSEAEESLYLLAPAKMPAQRWPKSTRPLPMTPYCGTVIRQRSGGTRLSIKPKNRHQKSHFDRSSGQLYRPLRSGEIRISTHPARSPPCDKDAVKA